MLKYQLHFAREKKPNIQHYQITDYQFLSLLLCVYSYGHKNPFKDIFSIGFVFIAPESPRGLTLEFHESHFEI
jgi:hypothetical protein